MDSATAAPPSPELDLDNLRALKVLGKGAMGTVFLVLDTTTAATPFALKVVDKTSIHAKLDADRRARWEIQVLSQLSHPFLPSILGTFESQQFLAWALPYCPGGDLNVLRYRQTDRVFSPAVIRFYLAEILCALDHLHSMGIAYRDLKPENVLIQRSGHVTLTDFDLSRKLIPNTIKITDSSIPLPDSKPPEPPRKHCRNFSRINGLKKTKSARVSPVSRRKPSLSNGERSNSFVGTEEYVSPEVVRGDGHEFAVDWWALGILTYEMMYGTTPFKGKNRKETFRNVVTKLPAFVGKRSALTDLIEKLLEKDPAQRLGYARGAAEIKEHEFFRGVRWDLLTELERPPFIPSRDDGVGESLEKLLTGNRGMDIRDYFQSLKSPSLPASPSPSPSSKFKRNVSLSEF
ncbi:serine/threonine-protein kinase UCN-like isoform X2 [Gastrolobium bilobum]|uniref:serine/threonine-protein kinase UCN-like isoform X2 n=1 Tax=Gastrolobium bilobum TaxID=150636 RepID=UPI002AB09122|nr:serine/threonine-protein kinase UCN-like isoform X2 [Gastrolobium bilobum]